MEESKTNYGINLNNKKCWYYDSQLDNELVSVSLHANQKYSPNTYKTGYLKGIKMQDKVTSSGDWGILKDEKTGETLKNKDGTDKRGWIHDENYYDWMDFKSYECDTDLYVKEFVKNKDNSGKVSEKSDYGCGYCLKPICTSILAEDFVVSSSNMWSDLGSDMIGAIWNTMRSTAPFNAFYSEALETMGDKSEEKGHTKLGDILHKVSQSLSTMSGFQDRSLVVTGTQFSLYGGTGFDYSNMGMRFMVFPKIENGKIITVQDQVRDMYPYFVGQYKEDESIEKLIKGLFKDGENLDPWEISSFVGWQFAPGGYKPNIHLLDGMIHKGTLKLRIGGLYSIPNLVVQSANFVFSKQLIKFPKDGVGPEIITTPLFCEITLMLHPMSKYSSRSLEGFLKNGSVGMAGSSDGSRNSELNRKINENLNRLKNV